MSVESDISRDLGISCEVTHERSFELPDSDLFLEAEGGAAYSIDREDGFYIVTSEGGAFAELDEDDRAGIHPETLYRFATAADRSKYVEYRGWANAESGRNRGRQRNRRYSRTRPN